MNIEELSNGDRVLLQSGQYVKEIAIVKTVLDNGMVLLKLLDGRLEEFAPQYIIKNFGIL